MARHKITPLAERFARYVDKHDLWSCWIWTGSLSNGYGQISRGRRGERPLRAHRVAWELTCGPIPDGLFVLHACDNRRCVNPAHLFLGTVLTNVRDMNAKGRNGTLGTNAHGAVLTNEHVQEIRESDETCRALAERFGVTEYTISRVRRGKSWKHVA